MIYKNVQGHGQNKVGWVKAGGRESSEASHGITLRGRRVNRRLRIVGKKVCLGTEASGEFST